MYNYMIILSYDGTRYNGWQKQGNTGNTIQAKLETVLSRIVGESIEVAASGRTDAGVHASHQVCSFRCGTGVPEDVLKKLRQYLPDDIGVESISEAPPRFHARLSCREKTYVYSVWNSDMPDVFERKYRYSFPSPLDDELMRKAASSLIGEHDFIGYCSNRKMKKSSVRILSDICIRRDGNKLDFILTGNGFLYNMVRIIAGTLLEVGSGQRKVSDAAAALRTLNRADAGFTAPAHGLCLTDVKY